MGAPSRAPRPLGRPAAGRWRCEPTDRHGTRLPRPSRARRRAVPRCPRGADVRFLAVARRSRRPSPCRPPLRRDARGLVERRLPVRRRGRGRRVGAEGPARAVRADARRRSRGYEDGSRDRFVRLGVRCLTAPGPRCRIDIRLYDVQQRIDRRTRPPCAWAAGARCGCRSRAACARGSPAGRSGSRRAWSIPGVAGAWRSTPSTEAPPGANAAAAAPRGRSASRSSSAGARRRAR